MRRPAYRLSVGDRTVDTTDEPRASTAVELDVRLDMDTPADALTVTLGQVGGLAPDVGDDATLELGYADAGDLTRVLTGTVVRVEPGVETTRVVAHSRADLLLRSFRDDTFRDVDAGDIVRALAGDAGLRVARADAGIRFAAYVVDGRRPAARHIRDLAELCGVDTYVTADGELVFEAFAGQRLAHELRVGVHLLEVDLRRAPPRAGTVEVYGESPGTGDGAVWLTTDFGPRRGRAGQLSPTLLVERPALRTAQAAATAATALHEDIQRRTLVGDVRIQGRPTLHLGDVVRLVGMADPTLDASYQARSIHHRLTKAGGFTTDVGVRPLAGGAS
jgi:phage protein D